MTIEIGDYVRIRLDEIENVTAYQLLDYGVVMTIENHDVTVLWANSKTLSKHHIDTLEPATWP